MKKGIISISIFNCIYQPCRWHNNIICMVHMMSSDEDFTIDVLQALPISQYFHNRSQHPLSEYENIANLQISDGARFYNLTNH